MKKILFFCLISININISAQISLGTGTYEDKLPIDSFYEFTYSQQIFPKTEINATAAGTITGLKFYLSPTANISGSNNWTVYLGHTTLTDFTNITGFLPTTSLTNVFTGTITNNAGVVSITLTTPFAYNNINNLVLAVDENNPGINNSNDRFYSYPSTTNCTVFYRDEFDVDPNNPPIVSSKYYNKSRITFEGLTRSSLGVEDVSVAKQIIAIYPNPAKDFLSIKSDSKIKSYIIYDLSGKTINKGTDVSGNINVSTLTKGTYLLVAHFENGTETTEKFVKQ